MRQAETAHPNVARESSSMTPHYTQHCCVFVAVGSFFCATMSENVTSGLGEKSESSWRAISFDSARDEILAAKKRVKEAHRHRARRRGIELAGKRARQSSSRNLRRARSAKRARRASEGASLLPAAPRDRHPHLQGQITLGPTQDLYRAG